MIWKRINLKRTIVCLSFIFLLVNEALSQQKFASWTDTSLKLDNGIVQRVIELPGGHGNFLTKTYTPASGGFHYFSPVSSDFQFEINGKIYQGTSKWKQLGIETVNDSNGGSGAAVSLLSDDGYVRLTIKYLLYPGLPVIRKSLIVKNYTKEPFMLESADVEKLSVTSFNPNCYSWVFSDYGRRRSLGAYEGNKQDALVMVFNPEWKEGILIGNEAPGVIKRTSVFWEAPEIRSGLTHNDALYPFRKWIASGDSFETPQIFTMLFNHQKDTRAIFNTALPDFIRRHMGTRLSMLKEKPTFVFNTWHPFQTNINESIVMELAKSAAAAGMKEFVIDDGWQDNTGDWGIDKKKFPNGLKPVFDYIKSLGMKPGLWISVGTASPDSKVYKEHPEWFVRDSAGKHTSLIIENYDKYTACFSTGWYGYIKSVLNKLALEYGLEYMKLDFSVVTSPYRYDHTASGCYAKDHPGHKDHNESLYTNYTSMWQLFDELHAAKPSLFIDCTFETMGGLQLIDYAMLKHADGNWLSNFYEVNQDGDLRVRNMAWWRSPAVSATALVIGNMAMQDSAWEMHIKSLAGALPIMLGDPRKLNTIDQKKYKAYSDWLHTMAARHDIMSYRQDLAGFGEPAEGSWDGFQRINTDTKSGGIAAVFKHGSKETSRTVTIDYLDNDKYYDVKEAITGKIIQQHVTGKQLSQTGFAITLKEEYAGMLMQVEENKTALKTGQ
ncbi:MAG: alpha-galactosidase [Chitinophagaceae bacterium]